MKEINLRVATMDDSDTLLVWRNDPLTRENSFNQSEVKREDHNKWIASMLARKADNLLLIAEWDGKPVGSFRLDKFKIEDDITQPDMRLISYVVAPEYRKRGLGYAIVSEGCTSYGQEYSLIARTRRGNVASRKILESCDFQCIDEENNIATYVRPCGNAITIQ